MEEKNAVRHLDNGVDLIKEDGQFYAVVEGERLLISREEVLLILSNHDFVLM